MSLTREKKLHRNLKHYYNRVSLSPFRPTNSHFLTSVSASCMCKCHVSSVIWTYLVKKTKAPFLSWTFSISYVLFRVLEGSCLHWGMEERKEKQKFFLA